jgi:hypothetical protein
MPLAILDASPSVQGLHHAALVSGLGGRVEDARERLRLDAEQLHPAMGAALEARIDLPPGTWRVWPSEGRAAWLGRRPGAVPRVSDEVELVELDLIQAIRRMHAAGLTCIEVQLFVAGGWTRPEDAYAGLSRLVAERQRVAGISGIFSGGDIGPARVELFHDGRVLASDPLDAERWLLVAHGMADVV